MPALRHRMARLEARHNALTTTLEREIERLNSMHLPADVFVEGSPRAAR